MKSISHCIIWMLFGWRESKRIKETLSFKEFKQKLTIVDEFTIKLDNVKYIKI